MLDVRRYQTEDGREPITEWLARLKDLRARARILVRVDRLKAGNFGDCRAVREGVSELRIDYGPGYRLYFGKIGRTVILLLYGGDKDTQPVDIDRAVVCLADFKRRVGS
ncbi:addiction module killer protein [Solidesulfovibrio carbinoliphilus subsp. oakridgensis]|uniref:Addiction module killer protein n=1 Tax=Solidesulfovibrio carbinoliphilus subsp. oakridgensis TaxID=694327 RepID=G7Q8K7_9BACT|nr:type II toxin-antitoxin system RelE/ParE family toxin [Solidesulfovibrio carbinoliphilus]EHJ49094.1 addiction module killer protein [Solidesulfovibrio carbinoliphilus subsp. oakridgensis]